MSQQELLVRLVTALDGPGIQYMLTGSIVSGLQGVPRSTHDIDVVVQIRSADLPAIVAAFPPERFYLDLESARNAIARADMFNLLDTDTGDKIDFWLLAEGDFNRSRFQRRYSLDADGTIIKASRPEDTILQKLKWCNDCGGSEKQFGDALGVFKVNQFALDIGYMESWIDRLDVRANYGYVCWAKRPADDPDKVHRTGDSGAAVFKRFVSDSHGTRLAVGLPQLGTPMAKKTAKKPVEKDPKGGLTAAGRKMFAKTEGANLKPGVKGKTDTPEKMKRKGSFLRRHFANPRGPMVGKDGNPTRLALSARAWGEPVPKTAAAAKKLAAKGAALLDKYRQYKESAGARAP